MVLIFWQGIISIHQKAFLEAVVIQPSVTRALLVVEEDITPYRKNMGWDAPEIKGVEIIRSPSENEIHRLIEVYKDAVHIVGGIRIGRMLSLAFDECIKHNCKLGIMTEPYDPAKLKGRLRTLKYKYYKWKYSRHIQFVLAIGKQGVKQFNNLGFENQKVFPWAYFMSLDSTNNRNESRIPGERRIIYAGRLEAGKGIYSFTETLIRADEKNYKLDMYGSGPDEEKIKKLVVANGLEGKINVYPFLKYEELLKQYQNYDWVVLPSSRKDGWGVIISEGLLNGLKALCSGICGVSWVIKDGVNGVVFHWEEAGSCKNAINRMLHDDSFADAGTISGMASGTISGNAGARYFIKILDCVYNHKERPGIPWQ